MNFYDLENSSFSSCDRYPELMQLLYSESSILVENTALLINIIHNHSTSTASLVKEVALNSGLLLQHFYNAVFNDLDGQRFFSRFLCSLWFSGPSKCLEKQLLARIIPSGFFSYLSMPMLSDAGKKLVRILYLKLILFMT